MSDKQKVLIVDDEDDLVSLLTLRLESEGYEVISAQDGQAGLDAAREQNPDLILMDVMMPVMDGYQACRFIKFDDTLKHIPVIMLTARTQAQDRSVGESVGADEYIEKPFEYHDLLEKIKKYIAS